MRLQQRPRLAVAAAASSFFAGAVVLALVSGWLYRRKAFPLAGGFRRFDVLAGVALAQPISPPPSSPRHGWRRRHYGLRGCGAAVGGHFADRIGFLGLAVREISFGRVGAVLLLAERC